ncbi:hypothetical protein D770_06425 [Flammeovirgaceae bacterium 311]|nr:hypothetical protein D770_06425 [Flammeovirgaceae bacterium 311]
MPLSFSYQAPGRIWQIKADLRNRSLALEVRNQLQEASFSYLQPLQDKVIFEGLTLEGGLLTNLVACHGGLLLFQQFDDLENPAEVTTVALAGQSQEVLWAVNNFRHVFFTAEECVGKTGEGEEEGWAAIHLVTGSIRELNIAEVKILEAAAGTDTNNRDELLLPAVFEEGENHFKTVADFLEMYLQAEALKSCEYLHVFDKMAISFYTADGEKLTNMITVFDAEGSLLLQQAMATDLLRPGSETFMVWNQQLFFIENSSCLKGYNLQ